MFQTSLTYELAESIHSYRLEIVEKARLAHEVEDIDQVNPGRPWFLRFRLSNAGLRVRPALANCQ